MSSPNAELARRFIWAFEHDADAFRELVHPDVEWAPFEENHTIFHGPESAMQIRNGWLGTWTEHRMDIEQVVERGDEVVIALHLTARGRGSGVEVDVRLYPHMRVQNGKIAYVFEYEDRAEALQAIGAEAP